MTPTLPLSQRSLALLEQAAAQANVSPLEALQLAASKGWGISLETALEGFVEDALEAAAAK